jgi:two-component system NtrC family sensor kinase
MKKTLIISILLFGGYFSRGQNSRVDSLLAQIEKTYAPDKMNVLTRKLVTIPQGSIALLKQGRIDLAKAETTGILKDKEHALLMMGSSTFNLRYAPELLNAALQGVRISRELKDSVYLERFLNYTGLANYFEQDIPKSCSYLRAACQVALAIHDTTGLIASYTNLESGYADRNMSDSAIYIARLEMKLATKQGAAVKYDNLLNAYGDYGEALMSANKPDSALLYYRYAYQLTKRNGKPKNFSYIENTIAMTYLKIGKLDSAAKYGLDAYRDALTTNYWEFKANAAGTLAQVYDGRDDKKSLFYLKIQMTAKDSITANEKTRQFNLIAEQDRQHDEELKVAQESFEATVHLYIVIGAAIVLLIIGIILLRSNRRQKHTNLLLSNQKEEISTQRDQLSEAFNELKITQTQLIQSEKMASLGELTAGIAHEIQNPLNFVNNFSEVNREMIDELKEELQKGDIEEAIAIANDIQQNEEKISHHGKRADFIVKGMLQHSRTNTGEKQLTNLNVLCDEFMKLSYHGLRAKDKDFNTELVTHFDEALPKVNIVQQDIGRVLLNLFNNAFYAVNEKKKTAGADYKPEVTVATEFISPPLSSGSRGVVITVKDNGNGIPVSIKDKIMQPFFTTKPTGEGTGLGLSLSYDIVVKGHRGSIIVDTKEGEFTEFTITLPLS